MGNGIPGQKGRKEFLKNLPAGTRVIDELSLDDKLSALIQRQPTIAQNLKKARKFKENFELPNMPQLRQYVHENYGPKLDGEYFERMKEHLEDVDYANPDPSAPKQSWRDAWAEAQADMADEAAEMLAENPEAETALFDPVKDKRYDAMINFIAGLDPSYLKEQQPLFGRNLLHDTMQRIQDGQTAGLVAMAAQKLIGQSLQVGKTTKDVQGDAFEKLVAGIKLNTPEAFENIIGHMTEGSKKAHAKIWSGVVDGVLEKIEKAMDKGTSGKIKRLHTFSRNGQKHTLGYDGDTLGFVRGEGEDIVLSPIDDEMNDFITYARGRDKKLGAELEDVMADGDEDAALRKFIEIMSKQDVDRNFLAKHNVPDDIYQDMTRWMKPFSEPEEIGAIRGAIDRFSNIFRANVTAPFPGFHVRNFMSATVQNMIYRAYDPEQWGPMRYIKPVQDAAALRAGKPIKGLAKSLDIIDDADIAKYREFQATQLKRLQTREASKLTPDEKLLESCRLR